MRSPLMEGMSSGECGTCAAKTIILFLRLRNGVAERVRSDDDVADRNDVVPRPSEREERLFAVDAAALALRDDVDRRFGCGLDEPAVRQLDRRAFAELLDDDGINRR